MKIDDGMVAYNLKVNVASTYGNSVYPDHYIDVYFKGSSGGKIVFGKLLSNVKVLAVKDSNGNHVFENTTANRTPSIIIFGVTEEMSKLLHATEYMSDTNLIIVPTNVSYRIDEGKLDAAEVVTELSDEEIKAYIESRIA